MKTMRLNVQRAELGSDELLLEEFNGDEVSRRVRIRLDHFWVRDLSELLQRWSKSQLEQAQRTAQITGLTR